MRLLPSLRGALATKQSISSRKERMDCFVASAPRNDVVRSRYNFAISRHDLPEVCKHSPSKEEGAGNAGCTLHPRSRAQCAQKGAHTSIQVKRRHPASPAQWLYGLWRALPGDRLVCHRRRANYSAPLDASTGASGPHAFAVRSPRRSSVGTATSTASHRAFRDDREPPLLSGETGGDTPLICPDGASGKFFR